MNKLLVNRSSKTVQLDAIGKMRQALQLMQEVLGDETPIVTIAAGNLQKNTILYNFVCPNLQK
jgi:hypothetical protein